MERKPKKLYKTHAELVRTLCALVSAASALTTMIVVVVLHG